MAEPKLAIEKLDKSHYSAFLTYADKFGIDVTTENLMAWDTNSNKSALSQYLEKKFGKEAIYAAGLKEMFKRYLYNTSIFSLEPSKALPKGVPPTSAIQRGVYIPTASPESMDTLIEASSQRLKNEARRLKLYKLPAHKIHALVTEALEG